MGDIDAAFLGLFLGLTGMGATFAVVARFLRGAGRGLR